ncbi:methyl-accepting chemotaxis protein [Paenibacillus rigui]|uniref:Serine chemoreceptor protein n=1 Tax=Paenibacillus rigui TaxID=554312 RepID=A0A229UNL0_9BACL|nr:HAMP domain-containing methyl-accepting chemotaxis protein [Paenibacillus rigui]OXM85087.1 serine chemoreceptor protein [Paenibacillus rigui]
MTFSLRRKMMGAFVLISLLVAAAGALSYLYLKQIDRSYAALIQDNVVIVQQASGIQTAAERQSGLLLNYVLEPSREKEQQLVSAHAELTASIDEMLQLAVGDEERSKVLKLKESNETFARLLTKVVDYVNRKEEGLAKSEALLWSAPLNEELRQTAAAIQDREKEAMASLVEENKAVVAVTIRTLAAVSAAALLIALTIGLLLSRAIVRPMRAIVGSAERIADWDLTVPDLHIRNRDEIGNLGSVFNRMKASLHRIVVQVGGSAERVTAAAEALSASSNQLSVSLEQVTAQVQQIADGTVEQVCSVQEGVALIETMSSSVKSITGEASSARETSVHALQAADEGQQAIETAMRQMDAIERTIKELAASVGRLGDRSAEVVQAVDVIAAIARQTNMLALNASIEASRAGESGKGFAVVAEEVRKLSMQTAAAAEDVASRIGGIRSETKEVVHATEAGTREVAIGMSVVRHAGQAFGQISEAVDRVAASIAQVSKQSQDIAEQSQAAVEAIRSVNRVAEQAAASAREVSGHTEQQAASMQEMVSSTLMLSSMAEELQQLLAKFRV